MKIYSLWLQGYENAPDLIKTCIDQWAKLNPTYTFELLEQSDVEHLLKEFPLKIKDITSQSLSDITRIALLNKNGGIWVDATVFPTKPLSDWLDATVNNTEFFTYQREGQAEYPKDRPISAWFLYTKKPSVIIEKLWNETLRYWSVEHYKMIDFENSNYYADPIGFMGLSQEIPNAPYPYHWFQHIFAYLIKTDIQFAKAWSSCTYKPITKPHQMQYWVREELLNKNATNVLTEEKIKSIIEDSEMQKLNWRMRFPLETMGKYSTLPKTGKNGC